MPDIAAVLAGATQWPVGAVSVAALPSAGRPPAADHGRAVWHGDADRAFPVASVTKLLTAYAVLLAVEEGAVELDEPAGPPGSTVRHLLAHASGLTADGSAVVAPAGTRRIYSNAGYEQLGAHVERAVGMDFAVYLRDGVLAPLGMRATELVGSPAHGAASTVRDLVGFATELRAPQLLHTSTLALATKVAFAGLTGVVPGFGRQDPNDWGLGPELHGAKSPHWMAPESSPSTFGHFGRSGSFLWVDPVAQVAAVCLTDTTFGPWAADAWPAFNSAVLAACR